MKYSRGFTAIKLYISSCAAKRCFWYIIPWCGIIACTSTQIRVVCMASLCFLKDCSKYRVFPPGSESETVALSTDIEIFQYHRVSWNLWRAERNCSAISGYPGWRQLAPLEKGAV